MRNLKRVLSLALALVMVLGMMVIGTSAATFTDEDQIEYKEAIAVMHGIDLFQGNKDGSMTPKQELTRAMAATIMARIMMGEKEKTLVATKQIFSDVPLTAATKWYAPAVEFCVNTGLIAGNGDGTFNPDGKLTGIAFAKLLLVALGYDADAQGYVGADWASSIAIDALNAGLNIKGVDLAANLTREQAAQMILQVLEPEEANMVYYTNFFNKDTGKSTIVGPLPVMNDAKDTFREVYYEDLVRIETDGTDVWGNPWDYKWVNGVTPLWTEKYAPVAEYFTAVDECDIVKDLGTDDDTAYTVYVDGKENDDTGVWNDTGKGYSMTGTGVWTRIYDTDNGYVAVAINTYFGRVTYEYYEKTDKNGHITQEHGYDVVVYDAAAKNNQWKAKYITDETFEKYDYVLVNVCNGKIAAIELAEFETETIKRISYNKNEHIRDTVTAKDGDVYGENVKFCNIYDAGEKDTVENLVTKTEYNLYLDGQGNIIAAIIPAPEASTIKWGIITRINWVDTNDDDIDGYAKFTLTGMDAESEAGLKLTEYLDEKVEYADKGEDKTPDSLAVSTNRQDNKAWHDNLYQYTLNKKTGTYEVTDVADTYEVYELTADTRFEVVVDGEYYRANNATEFLIKVGNNSYKSYTGWKNVPELLAKDGEVIVAQYFLKGNYVSKVFIDATDVIWAGESVIVYIADVYSVAEDTGLYVFNAFAGTKENEYVLADGVELKNEGLHVLSFNSDNEVISVDPVSDTIWYELVVDGAEGGVLEVLAYEFEDYDIDEVPFYYVNNGAVKDSDPSYVDDGDSVWVLTNRDGDELIAVYTGDVAG